MIVDFRDFEKNSLSESELCIIGAGAAGITLAREFIGSQVRVCLLESGGLEYDSNTQALADGQNVGLPYFDLVATRLRFFGGTTNHWAGICSPLSPIDFEKRTWVPYSGWPITKIDLDRYYERAQDICELGPYQYGSEIWKHQGLKDPGFLPEKLVTKFWQVGPPTRFGRVYRDELVKANNVTVILNANVANIQIDKQGGHVTRVDLKTLTGRVGEVHAKKFVVCCGCIENARLLLVSNSITPNGLGNDRDLVGRFFMEHPGIPCGIVASDDDHDLADRYTKNFLNGVQYRAGIVAADLLQKEKKILHCCASVEIKADPEDGTKVAQQIWKDYKTYGRLSDDLLDKVWQVAKDLDDVAYNIYRRFVLGKGVMSPIKYLFLKAHLEQAPNPDSRVLLSGERDALGIRKIQLKWQLTELDKFTIRKLTEAIGLEFGRQNVGRVRIEEWLLTRDNTWPNNLRGEFHHMGTTRMADDPREGVVDKNCKVHGIRNLFIAGSSVFSTSGYVNPTLTIVALTLRLAEHLKTQFA